jgi:flagellar biosynthesis GTPase FlhF
MSPFVWRQIRFQGQGQMQADDQRFWCFALPGAHPYAPAISARPGVLRRALRRVGGQTIVLAFIVLDSGGLAFALVASAWLVPWMTLNVVALLLGTLSWSEDWRIRREGATAARRQAEKMRVAQSRKEAEYLREAGRRRCREQEEREAQRRLQAALQQAEEQLREAEQRRRAHEEEEREAQRRQQAEEAERLRQAQQQQEARQQKEEEQRREAEQRRRQAEEEGGAQRERQRKRKPAAQLATDWWTVLGVAPSAGKEEIVRSYRRKIKQCHPDRLAGLAPALLQMAEEQAKLLNGAYASAMRARR